MRPCLLVYCNAEASFISKALLGKEGAGARGGEDTLETFSLSSEKGSLLSPSRPLLGQQVLNTYQSLEQTLLRPSSFLLFIGKGPIFAEQTFVNRPGP